MAKPILLSRAKTKTPTQQSAPAPEKKPAKKAVVRASSTRATTSGSGELVKAMAECTAAYAGAVRRADTSPLFNCIPTGAFALDYALMGGIPEGLATLLFGREGSGKTTVAIRQVREMQQKYPDSMVLWVDAERTFDPQWAELHGVDLKRLHIVEPDDGQQAIDIVTRFSHVLDCVGIIVDSIPALIPKALNERSAYDVSIAELARIVGILCSKTTSSWAVERKRGHYVTNIYINQLRSAMNARLAHATHQPGGHQLQYFVTTRIKLTGREVLSNEVKKKELEAHGLAVAEDKKDKAASTPEFVEHTFDITKAKIGSSMRAGDFRMNVNPAHPLLGIGEYDNAQLVMLFAKRVGMLRGAAGHYYLHGVTNVEAVSGNADTEFRKFSDMNRWLCENKSAGIVAQRLLIGALRLYQRKPVLPPDKYLLGRVLDVDMALASEFSGSAVSDVVREEGEGDGEG